MKLLHSVQNHWHSNYNTREQIQNAAGPLSFDGIYKSVYDNRDLLKGRDVTLFIMGDYIGKNNQFDLDQHPNEGLILEDYCDWKQLMELKNDYGCKLAWHTWSHRDLTSLSELEIIQELSFGTLEIEKVLAYPYGRFNDKVIEIAKRLGYKEAYSVFDGDNSAFQKRRDYV